MREKNIAFSKHQKQNVKKQAQGRNQIMKARRQTKTKKEVCRRPGLKV